MFMMHGHKDLKLSLTVHPLSRSKHDMSDSRLQTMCSVTPDADFIKAFLYFRNIVEVNCRSLKTNLTTVRNLNFPCTDF